MPKLIKQDYRIDQLIKPEHQFGWVYNNDEKLLCTVVNPADWYEGCLAVYIFHKGKKTGSVLILQKHQIIRIEVPNSSKD